MKHELKIETVPAQHGSPDSALAAHLQVAPHSRTNAECSCGKWKVSTGMLNRSIVEKGFEAHVALASMRLQAAENEWLAKHRNHLGQIVSVRLNTADEPKVIRRLRCEQCKVEFKFEAGT